VQDNGNKCPGLTGSGGSGKVEHNRNIAESAKRCVSLPYFRANECTESQSTAILANRQDYVVHCWH